MTGFELWTLELEATALPTEPQPLPQDGLLFGLLNASKYAMTFVWHCLLSIIEPT